MSRLVVTVRVPDSASFARAEAAFEPPDSVPYAADTCSGAPPDSDSTPDGVGDDQARLDRSDLDFADLHRIDVRLSGPDATRTIRLLPDEPSETTAGAAFTAPAVSDFTLSDLYTIRGLFSDTNEGLVPDRVDAYISLHGADAPSGPVDLATRIGLESAGIRLPLVRTAGQDDYPEILGFPILYGIGHYQTERLRDEGQLHTAGGEPAEGFVEVVPEAFGDEHALVISGSDAAGLGAISDYVARRLPYLWEHGRVSTGSRMSKTRSGDSFRDGVRQASSASQPISSGRGSTGWREWSSRMTSLQLGPGTRRRTEWRPKDRGVAKDRGFPGGVHCPRNFR